MKKQNDSELFTNNVNIDFDYNEIRSRVDVSSYEKPKRRFLSLMPSLLAGVTAVFVLFAAGLMIFSDPFSKKEAAIPERQNECCEPVPYPENTKGATGQDSEYHIEEKSSSPTAPLPEPSFLNSSDGEKSDKNVSTDNGILLKVMLFGGIFVLLVAFLIIFFNKKSIRKEK